MVGKGKRATFVKQTIQVSQKQRDLCFEEWIFHISESSQSDQNKLRKQNNMVGCTEGVDSIHEGTKSICFSHTCIPNSQNSDLLVYQSKIKLSKVPNE